jgi:serine/threonine protein kinase
VAPTDPFGLIGQVLDGQFRVDRYVGEGGFSIVYQGTHIGLSEPIAVKCLKLPGALGSALVESFVRRFRDESRLHYKLSQGNLHIVRSMSSGTTIAPTTSALVPYTVLEWLDGRSLAEEFAQRRGRGLRGMPMDEVVKLLDSAIDAVAHAHAQGVVHRDLNPGNLFLARTGSGTKLKVLDFGVAKILADSALSMGPTARTVGNVRMFAPAYGAPEQFDERVGAIGPWTDVYALALVTLEALTDRTVREGQHLGEFAMRALDGARRPTARNLGVAVGDHVETVFARALAIPPGERPRDAGELWGSLKHAIRADAASGRPPHATRQRSEPPPPNTLRIATSAPEGSSPAIEVIRPSSVAPSQAANPLTSTLRISPKPRSGSEALAALRTPPPPAMTPAPTTTSPVLTPVPPAPAVPRSAVPTPPPIVFRASVAPEERRERSTGRLVVLLTVLVLVVLAAGAFLLWSRSHRGAPRVVSASRA